MFNFISELYHFNLFHCWGWLKKSFNVVRRSLCWEGWQCFEESMHQIAMHFARSPVRWTQSTPVPPCTYAEKAPETYRKPPLPTTTTTVTMGSYRRPRDDSDFFVPSQAAGSESQWGITMGNKPSKSRSKNRWKVRRKGRNKSRMATRVSWKKRWTLRWQCLRGSCHSSFFCKVMPQIWSCI